MSNTVVQRRLQIIIDETGAQQALDKLTKSADKLEKEIAAGTAAGRDMAKELVKLESTKGRMDELSKVISGKVAPSFRQVSGAVNKLRNELALMSADTPGYAEKFARFKEVSATFETMKGKVNGVRTAAKSFFSEIKTIAVGVTVGNAITGITEAITGFIGGAISGAGKLSDELADIKKATGLTTGEIEKLNSELSKSNTRTASADLRKLAVALGQAGEAATSENILALDKINVALGDEFGGNAQEIGNILSVLRNNLQDIKTGNYGTDIEFIGNALNVLGASGLATAPVVSDIANRIAGVAQTFGVSSGQILGVGASFQELGINTERGSTAYIKLLQRMAGKTEEFAKVAGVPLEQFKNLVNTDINEALLLVAKNSKAAADSNTGFAATLKELDSDGAGASELLSKLAANGDLVRQKISLASAAIKDNSSILAEFETKNTTLGAQMEKLSKNIASAFSSSTLRNAVSGLVRLLNDLFDTTNKQDKAFQQAQVAFEKTTKTLDPLYDRYLKLKNQTTLNIEEQQELNTLIQKIADIVPSAATAIDEYGNAIDINTGKLANWRETQKDFIKDLNRDAINSLQDDVETALTQLSRYTIELQTKLRINDTEGAIIVQSIIAKKKDAALKAAEELEKKYGVDLPLALQESINKIKESIGLATKIDGGILYLPSDSIAPGTEKKKPGTPVGGDKSSGRSRRIKSAKDDLAELLKELQRIETELFQNSLDPYQKRLDQIARKYQELLARSGKNIEVRQRILKDLLAETQQLNKEFAAAAEEEMAATKKQFEEAQKTEDQGNAEAERNGLKDAEDVVSKNSRNRLAAAELAALQTSFALRRNFTAKAQLNDIEAQKKYLTLKTNQEIANGNYTANEIKVIRENLAQQIADLESNANIQVLDNLANQAESFLSGYTAITDVISSLDEARLSRLEDTYDREQNGLRKLLDQKLISQREYNNRSASLDDKLQKEKATIAKKEHKRAQIIGTTQVLIDAARGAIGLWARPGFPANIPLLILLAAQAAASIVKINSQKAPTFSTGGIPDGPRHSSGGIALMSRGQKIGEMEGGEAIINRDVTAANRPLINQLISAGKANDFNPIMPGWYSTPTSRLNVGRISSAVGNAYYAGGGLAPMPIGADPSAALNTAMLQALLTRLNQPIYANLVYGQYETVNNTVNSIRREGSITA